MTTPQRVNDGDPRTGGLQPVHAFDALGPLGRQGAWLFVNASERRLRAGWRLLAQAAVLLLATWLLGSLPHVLRVLSRAFPMADDWLGAPLTSPSMQWLLFATSLCLRITGSVWIARRFVDRRSFASLGVSWNEGSGRDLFLGVLIAGLIQSVLFGIEQAAGWLRVDGFCFSPDSTTTFAWSAATMCLVFAMGGWHEELLARGYWLTNLAEGRSYPLAVLISSSAFALGHTGNPNVTWVAIVVLLGPAFLFAWAVLRTGRLWLAIGLHFGWNLFEGVVFGFPVSGIATATLIRSTVEGPALWTGGKFGPEAGLVVIPALLTGWLAVGLATRGRDARSSASVD
jgi:membrane protease YdiL (CAAX protease family)